MFHGLCHLLDEQVRLTGIYIMQNTLVRGGGGIENQKLWEKNEEGERKKEENYIKKQGKRP